MASGQIGAVLDQVRRLFGPGTVAGMGEAQLLERFATGRDEVAFAALVARHGPTVLGVCRGLLADPNDADDAFQATFLVLVKRARGLRDPDRLGPWLYGVAHRVAARARADAARRRRREAPDPAAADALAPADDAPHRRELTTLLHEELNRLPEKYRAPLVLCYLEGLTHDQAALRLRWPVGTVRGRMARGRDLLRSRLARRGIAPTTGLLAATLAPARASAAVPPPLAARTVRAAMRVAAGHAAAGVVSAPAARWMRETLRTLLMTRLTLAASLLLAAGLATAGAGVLAGPAPEDRPEPDPPPVKAEAKPQAEEPEPPPPDDRQAEAEIRRAEELLRRQELVDRIDQVRASTELRQIELDALKDQIRELTTLLGETRIGLVANISQRPTIGGTSREDREGNAAQAEELLVSKKAEFLVGTQELGRQRRELDDLESQLQAARSADQDLTPYRAQVGDRLLVEVLEALPGRPISGERVVRSDGTISLGFYGDLPVVGLTREEIKVKLIEHLRKTIDDGPLGLFRPDPADPERKRVVPVPPADSDRVFVDEVPRDERPSDRLDALERKLDRVLDELKARRRAPGR